MRRLLLIAILAAGIAGCSGPADDGIASATGTQPSATASATDDPVAFSQCMRDHGQDLAAPRPDGSWDFNPRPREAPAGWDEAIRACQHLIQMPTDDGLDPAELEKLRAFAVCMREHDIPITDPQIGGDRPGNMRIGGRFENVTRDQLEADPVYKAAMAACKDKLPAAEKKGS